MSAAVRERCAAALPYAAFLMLGFGLFPAAGRDDSHITFWTVHALVEWGEIVNYNGERVEQSSSLLQTLLLWPLAEWLPVSIVTLGYGFSILCGLLALHLTGRYSGLPDPDRRLLQLLLAMTGPFLYWSYGGLETPITACTMLGFLMAWRAFCRQRSARSLLALAGTSLLYVMVRPEAIFVLIAFYVASLTLGLRYRQSPRAAVTGLLLALAGCAALTGWRLWYFGDWFPQPVTAKVGIPTDLTERVRLGVEYLWKSMIQLPVLAPLLLAMIPAAWRTLARPMPEHRTADDALMLCAAQLAFAISSGGDWMPAGRFLAPAMPMLLICVWPLLSERWKQSDTGMLATLSLASLIWFAHFVSESYSPLHYDSYRQTYGEERGFSEYSYFERLNFPHLRDIVFLARSEHHLRRYVTDGTGRTIMSVQAGMIPYYLQQRFPGQLEFIDANGLSTRHLTDCAQTAGWGRYHGGVDFDYRAFFEQLERLEDACGLRAPDFVYDLSHARWNSELPEILEQNGYSVLYRQQGYMNQHRFPRGRLIPIGEILAVNKQLIMRQWLDALH